MTRLTGSLFFFKTGFAISTSTETDVYRNKLNRARIQCIAMHLSKIQSEYNWSERLELAWYTLECDDNADNTDNWYVDIKTSNA